MKGGNSYRFLLIIPVGQRGMALLITIMVLSLLIAVTLQFTKNVHRNYFTAATQIEGQRLSQIARSGLTIGQTLLEADGNAQDFDTLLDSWAILEKNSFTDQFPRGELELSVTDLSGRFQVNSLVQPATGEGEGGDENNSSDNKEILKRLLLSGRFQIENENEAQEIVDALVDWLDEDDRESDFGAESSYYRSLERPYECRNGPVEILEELLLVRGITPELLYGDDDRPGLADFVTVYGADGKINLNTAPVELVEALHPLMTEELAISLDEYRLEEANLDQLESADWYLQMPAWPGDIRFPETVVSTNSSFFGLSSIGVFGEQQRSIAAVVERTPEKVVNLVYIRVE